MSMSGVEIDQTVTDAYNEILLKKNLRYVLFMIENKKKVIVDEKAPKDATWDEFVQKLMDIKSQGEARYALYDVEFVTLEGRKLQKLCFIFWCPDDTKVSSRMIYASTKDSVKKAFTGIGIEFQFNAADDLNFEDVKEEIRKRSN